MKSALFILCEERCEAWPDLLSEVCSHMNALPNSSTKLSPHTIITGREPNLGLPMPDSVQIRANDQQSYARKIADRLRSVSKAVKVAANEADETLDQKNPKNESPPLAAGAKVFLHRPQSAIARNSKCDWIGPFEVVKSNNMVVKIQFSETKFDWVHRHQVRVWNPVPPI